MEHSVFCLALAGDSPSTRRLSEIFLAGVPPIALQRSMLKLPVQVWPHVALHLSSLYYEYVCAARALEIDPAC